MNAEKLLYNMALASLLKEAMAHVTPTAEHHVLPPELTDLAYHRGAPPGPLRAALGGALPTALAGGAGAMLAGGAALPAAAVMGLLGGAHGLVRHLSRPEPWAINYSIPRDRVAHPETPDTLAGAADYLDSHIHARPGGHYDKRIQEIRKGLVGDGGRALQGERMPLDPQEYDEHEKLRPEAAEFYGDLERMIPKGRPPVLRMKERGASDY